MKVENVVPFGRLLDEYKRMFNLSENDLRLNILGVADGPASFNAELTAKGSHVTSIDPIYAFEASEIQKKFDEVLNRIIDQVKSTSDDWVWSYHRSPEDLRANRIRAMGIFVRDFTESRKSKRYVVGELPHLPFKNDQFDLAICSHFLFLYSAHFTYGFHLASIREMLRVAREIRIFPLVILMLEKSPYIEPVQRDLSREGFAVEINRSGYELQRGGNEVMVIKK